ncbi:Protein of unknown function [Oryzisolibacter propanilivorax]|uniref:DUF3079 domain-containing protein n=1 Tax=Oryzisolibacter propanilivorax TaxID=1527607 RepID=A0A1G9TIR2_9BURK|nr:DUF3079 domain-containing protein [Oryzisolibacter propanilivorax]SDM47647.1 Protein of unknown function [Oryzisolibacter propanilivorax]
MASTPGPRRKKFPVNPAHPERTCWGCDRYCAADAMLCGNGSERSQHPAELFGPDWAEWLPPEEGGGAAEANGAAGAGDGTGGQPRDSSTG